MYVITSLGSFDKIKITHYNFIYFLMTVFFFPPSDVISSWRMTESDLAVIKCLNPVFW